MGSSPLARGTRTQELPVVTVAGLIPARAGNTRSSHGHHRVDGAHPRSRGEHRCASRCRLVWLGSSPLARGTPPRPFFRARRPGLIPARAGNTPASIALMSELWAHPRSRGEHPKTEYIKVFILGSSPLARGTLDSIGKFWNGIGLIPARAGNTALSVVKYRENRAHPRSRGEHMLCDHSIC